MLSEATRQSLNRRATLQSRVSGEEWQARVTLAACYRLCVPYGMTDLIYNHISLRIPGTDNQFLINAFGFLYEEVTASNLVKIDLDGNALDEDPLDINPTGFVIHSALHRARPDAACIFHTHTKAGSAVSSQKHGLLPISQHALRFHNRVGYHAFDGLALNHSEQERLARSLGPHNALILANHGLLTCGKSVRDAFELMYYLETACRIQIDALAGGTELIYPPEEVRERTAQQFENFNPFVADRDWHALLRKLDRSDDSYKS
ncbi:class II aldolase/adducin family protein [Bradyrhizobium sp. dw_411]|uniref:class II aldolase/adducin family protein n=1 Tax=Bradyrhizobium sp. dw_411 TaxID=2720082 RepID=UPI001BD0A05F|nr:class II aldolase/adducin family protein [Bradyrhizobium sp. dw_411]